jgi:hypothetical protein
MSSYNFCSECVRNLRLNFILNRKIYYDPDVVNSAHRDGFNELVQDIHANDHEFFFDIEAKYFDAEDGKAPKISLSVEHIIPKEYFRNIGNSSMNITGGKDNPIYYPLLYTELHNITTGSQAINNERKSHPYINILKPICTLESGIDSRNNIFFTYWDVYRNKDKKEEIHQRLDENLRKKAKQCINPEPSKPSKGGGVLKMYMNKVDVPPRSRGIASRAYFYMLLLLYDELIDEKNTFGSKSFFNSAVIEQMLEWNSKNAPDSIEKQINNKKNDIQGTKNPFVDNHILINTIISKELIDESKHNHIALLTNITCNTPPNNMLERKLIKITDFHKYFLQNVITLPEKRYYEANEINRIRIYDKSRKILSKHFIKLRQLKDIPALKIQINDLIKKKSDWNKEQSSFEKEKDKLYVKYQQLLNKIADTNKYIDQLKTKMVQLTHDNDQRIADIEKKTKLTYKAAVQQHSKSQQHNEEDDDTKFNEQMTKYNEDILKHEQQIKSDNEELKLLTYQQVQLESKVQQHNNIITRHISQIDKKIDTIKKKIPAEYEDKQKINAEITRISGEINKMIINPCENKEQQNILNTNQLQLLKDISISQFGGNDYDTEEENDYTMEFVSKYINIKKI